MLNRLRFGNELPLCIHTFGLLVLNRSSLLLPILNCFPLRRDGRYISNQQLRILEISPHLTVNIEIIYKGGPDPLQTPFGTFRTSNWSD